NARFVRAYVFAELVPVKRQRSLDAQRVACPETARRKTGRRAGFGKSAPERHRSVRRAEQLGSVFARVSGARREHVDSGDASVFTRKPRERRNARRELLENTDRGRTLNGDEPGFVAAVGDGRAADRMREDPREILGGVRRIDADVEALGAEAVDDDVVDDAPALVADH